MRPERLVMANFGPFAGRHEIDFTALGDIFLVFGKTGAGKTTIFDAIAYAIYGTAPGARKGLERQMRCQFADDDDESAVELTFSLGAKRYRVRRSLPGERVGKRSGKAQKTLDDVTLEEWRAPAWESRTSTNKSDTERELLSLIGLSEEEFSRIVLLPQGEFAKFLRQNSTERKQVLSKLFPVERHGRVIELARNRAREAEALVADTERSILSLGERFNPLSWEADRLALSGAVDAAKANLASLRRLHSEHAALREKARAHGERRAERDRLALEVARLEGMRAAMEASRSKIALARRAFPLVSSLDRIEELRDAGRASNEDLAAVLEAIANATDEISALSADRERLIALAREREGLLVRKERLAIAAGIAIELASDIAESSAMKDRLRPIADREGALVAAIGTVTESLSAQTAETAALEERSEADARARSSLDLARELKALAEEYARERLSLAGHEGAARESRARLAETVADARVREAELLDLERLAARERETAWAGTLAASLVAGEPCPVCGSADHPRPARAGTLEGVAIQDRIDAARRNLDDLSKRTTKLTADASAHDANLATAQGRVQALIARYCETSARARGEPTDARCISPADIPPPAEAAERLKGAAETMQEAHDALVRSQKALREADRLRAERERSERELTSARAEKATLEAAIAAKETDIAAKERRYLEAFPAPDAVPASVDDAPAGNRKRSRPRREFDPAEAAEAIEIVSARTLAIDAELSASEERKERTMKALASLEGRRDDLRRATAKNTESLAAAEREFSRSLAEAGFEGEEAVRSAAIDTDETEKAERAIDEWNRELAAAKGALAGTEKELASWSGPEASEIDRELASIDSRVSEADRTLEEKSAAIAEIDSLKRHWDELEAERAERSSRAGTIKALSQDLSGANPARVSFDAWILGMYLEEIAAFANERLNRMSEGRYRIQLNESYRKGNNLSGLELEILDSYTGKARPSGTLSGGETFMASISLALGLADSIQSRSGGIQLDAVFIDEGFGSLDEASLERAISILDEIRGHRMVGIISHVAELRTRIPSRIEIVKQASGSAVRKEISHD